MFKKIEDFFTNFERWIAFLVSVLIALIIVISFARVAINFYELFIEDIGTLRKVTFEDYQTLFGKILTLLIGLEFMNSILKVLKSHEMKEVVSDVILIAALAIGRKLIVYDYDHYEAMHTISLATILLSLGVFYFFLKSKYLGVKK